MRATTLSSACRLGIAAGVVVCLAFVQPANAAIDWGGTRNVGPPSTWSPGNSLASVDNRLLTAWASDCPPPRGACANLRGSSMGVFVQRASLGGTLTWSKPFRISRKSIDAERASIAGHGTIAIAGWVTQRSYTRYDGGAPRAFYVRRSADRGGSWSKPIRLSPLGGRVDYPQLAVTDGAAYAVWTNADNGAIRLATSNNGGKRWTTKTVGTTTASPDRGEGLAGYPTVGASGDNVTVSWFADDGGRQLAKSSSTRGVDLSAASPAETLTGSSPSDGFHYAVARGASDGVTNDVAIAYTTDGGIAARVFDGSSLGPQVPVIAGSWPTQIRGRTYAGATGPVVQPFGAQSLAAVFSACRDTALSSDCRSTKKAARVEVLSTSSTDGGGSWSEPDRIGGVRGIGSRINDAAGLVVTRHDKRFVLWNMRDARYSFYRLALTAGTGTP